MAPSIGDPGPTLTPILRAILEREPARQTTPARSQPAAEPASGTAAPEAKFTGVLDTAFVEDLSAKLETVFQQAHGLEQSLAQSRGAVSQKLLELADELFRVYVIIAAVASATGDESTAETLAKQAEKLLGRGPEAVGAAKDAIKGSEGETDADREKRLADLVKLTSSLAASARSIAGYADKAAETADERDRREVEKAADRLRARADAIEKATIPDPLAKGADEGGGATSSANPSRAPSSPPAVLSTEA